MKNAGEKKYMISLPQAVDSPPAGCRDTSQIGPAGVPLRVYWRAGTPSESYTNACVCSGLPHGRSACGCQCASHARGMVRPRDAHCVASVLVHCDVVHLLDAHVAQEIAEIDDLDGHL